MDSIHLLDPTTEDPPADWALLGRYVADACADAERAWVEQWLADRPERARYLASLRREVSAAGRLRDQAGAPFSTDGGWTDIAAKLALGNSSTVASQRSARAIMAPSTGSRLQVWPTMVAGAAAIVVGIFVITSGGWRPSAGQRVRDFVTPAGSHATLTLRDGTRVVLGPASRLRLAADFGRANRTVELDGEGYFSVVHDAAHPFVVRAARAMVTDIGTAFDVCAYAEDRQVRVTVTQGEVALRAPSITGSRALRIGDMADLTDTSAVFTQAADVSAMTAWMQDRLVFNETPLAQVARELSRVFHLSVTVADSTLAAEHFTGAYDTESADEVLDEITRSAGALYERNGRNVIIRRAASSTIHARPHPIPSLTTAEALRHAGT